MPKTFLIWSIVLVVVGIGLCFVPIGGYCVDGEDYSYCGGIYLNWVGVPLIATGVVVALVGTYRRRRT